MRPGLYAALAITLAATGWLAFTADESEPPLPAVAAAPRAAAARPEAPAAPAAPAETLPRNLAGWPLPEPLAAAAWGEPVPAPPQAPVQHAGPAPEPAPDPPWRLLGMESDGAVRRAFLLAGAKTVVARAGDLLDGQWQVVAIEDHGVTLRWTDGEQRVLAYAAR